MARCNEVNVLFGSFKCSVTLTKNTRTFVRAVFGHKLPICVNSNLIIIGILLKLYSNNLSVSGAKYQTTTILLVKI